MSSAQARLVLDNSDLEITRDATVTVDQGTYGAYMTVQRVTHTATNIVRISNATWGGPVTTPYYIWIRNLDATNYVRVGRDDSGTMRPMARLEAGEMAMFPIDDSITLYAQADTASVDIETLVMER